MDVYEIKFSELICNDKLTKNEIMLWHGFSPSVHYHDFYEVSIVTGGTISATFNGEAQKLDAGTVAVIRPYDVHYKSDDKNGVLYNFAISEKSMRTLFEYLGNKLSLSELMRLQMIPLIRLNDSELAYYRTRLKDIFTRFEKDEFLVTLEAKIVLADVMTKFHQFYYSNSNTPVWLNNLLLEVQKEENFSKGLQALIDISGKSQEYLCRVFKKYFNTTPSKYINMLRLNYSADLLMNSEKDIVTIAYETGFTSLSHYYHSFKKKFGTSPKAYRTLRKPALCSMAQLKRP